MNDLSPTRTDKFKAYRARKKAAGLREVRSWVPDVRSPEFLAKLRADMALTSKQNDEGDVMAFIETATSDLWD
jgi:hypothetical protein